MVPDRLAYREFITDQFRYVSYFDDAEKEVQELANQLESLSQDFENNNLIEALDLSTLYWENLKQKYRQEFSL